MSGPADRAPGQRDLERLAREVGRGLAARGWRLATAESCTGGWVAQVVTSVPGSSAWFDRGFVVYSNEAKVELLGLAPEILDRHGAVSEAAVAGLAAGALERSAADVAVAVSGVAGPGGGTPAKPIGTVCLGWARRGRAGGTRRHRWPGDRRAVRARAVAAALEAVRALAAR